MSTRISRIFALSLLLGAARRLADDRCSGGPHYLRQDIGVDLAVTEVLVPVSPAARLVL